VCGSLGAETGRCNRGVPAVDPGLVAGYPCALYFPGGARVAQ